MNHFVPNFDMDKDYPIPGSSETPSSSQLKRTSTADEDILELLWHNGQPVALNQSQRLSKRSSPLEQSSSQLEQQQQQQQQQFFMHEDEMCSWLHYPLVEDSSSFDHNFCAADLLYPPPPPPSSSFHTTSAASTTTMATTTLPVPTSHVNMSEPKPPPQSYASSGGGGSFAKQSMPPSSLFSMPRTEPGPGPGPGPGLEPSLHNFGLFARHKAITVKPGPSSSKAAPLHTVVDSSETPLIEVDAAKQRSVEGEENLVGGIVGTGGSSAGGERGVCNAVVSSTSPRGSSVSGELGQKQHVDDRKRKGREIEEAEGQSEDVEFESTDTKKQARGSTSTKRSRAAEVHNLSERRRRDRINEKMRALQELIPRCNKSDKASMLDEAIEYLKSLQLQIQMMSMGYGMVPMMYPGIQQYMPPMGMGLGMGMNMEMGMNRPMMPYPNVLPNSAYPASGASAHMGPRHPMTPPPFHMQPAAVQDPSRFQNNQSIPMMNPVGAPYPIPPGVPFYTDPYQQYHGLPQQQIHLTQNQVMPPPSTSKPGSSGRTDDVDNPKSG